MNKTFLLGEIQKAQILSTSKGGSYMEIDLEVRHGKTDEKFSVFTLLMFGEERVNKLAQYLVPGKHIYCECFTEISDTTSLANKVKLTINSIDFADTKQMVY